MRISRSTKKYQKQMMAYNSQLESMIDTIRSERAVERRKLASQKSKKMLEESEQYMLSKGYSKKDFINESEEMEELLRSTEDKSFFTESDDFLKDLAMQRLKECGIEPPTTKKPFVVRHPMLDLYVQIVGFGIFLLVFIYYILPFLFRYTM